MTENDETTTKLWKLNSLETGSDELLVADTEAEATEYLAHYHGWTNGELPNGWELEEVPPKDVTAGHILSIATEELRTDLLENGKFPISQQWGDGRAYPLECGDWVVDTACGYAEEGWCEGYECECGEIYTDQHECSCLRAS